MIWISIVSAQKLKYCSTEVLSKWHLGFFLKIIQLMEQIFLEKHTQALSLRKNKVFPNDT